MRALATLLAWYAGWTSFRGDNGFGVDSSKGLPSELAPDKHVAWRTPLPLGASSPVLARDRIYLTGYENKRLVTFALDRATGAILWRRELSQPRAEALHKLNNPASATPATDGANVYSFFGDFGLVSYGPDGNERWRLPLGPFSNLHGMAASPILAGDKLIYVSDQDTDSYVLAVNKDTGKQVWKTRRPVVVHGFATPTLFTPEGGAQQVVIPGSYLLASYSVATGEELWTVRGLSWQIKSTGIAHQGTLYMTGWAPGADAGQSQPLPPFEDAVAEIDANKDGKISPEELNPSKYKHGGSWGAIDLDHDGFMDARDWSFYRARRSARNVTIAVRPGGARGDLTDTHVVWRTDRNVPQVSSPLLYDGVLYVVKDGGIFTSMDPASGRVLKTARIPGAIDNYYSSPVAGDGKVYVASETGKVSVLKPGGEWEPIAVREFEENIYATPAIEGGRIYLRTTKALYCFAK
jgi:outer membrane protein assembly factor BamB